MEAILAMFAAIICMSIAGLLVRDQKRRREYIEKLENENTTSFNNIVDEVEALTSEPLAEQTIQYVEKRLDMFEKSLAMVRVSIYPMDRKGRGKRRGKDKRRFGDDGAIV